MRKLSTDLIKSGSFTGSFSGSVVGTITSASFASTASYLLNSFSLTTGSTYPITSSWSNNSISSSFSNTSISSSYSLTSSNLSPVAQDLIPISNSLYSLGSPTNKWKDLYVSTGSIYIGNVVLSTSGSTLYADVQPIVTLNTASGQIQISGMSASLSASYSNTSSISLNAISSSYGLTSSYSFFANDANNSSTSTSASYSSTASVALNALTSSYINVATNAVSSSFASTASISVSSSFAATSSYNLNSISSSYSLTASFAANAGSSLTTGSTYPITASWSNNSISSSYSTFAVSSNSATSANTATSASYATVAGSSTSATTANSATSASYSLTSSYSINSTTATSSSFASTASYNLNSISSSFSVNSLTASYIVNSISSSYALTASYALNAGSGGGSTTTSSLIGQTFVPTASVSQLSLTQSVSNNDQILVILDGLVQSRTGSYTVSGSTLTLTENADSGSNIDVRFLGGSSSGGSSVSSSYALTSSFSSTSAPRTAIYRYGTTSIVNPGGYADTIIKYDTAVIDTTSWYNNSNGRFTPDVAGWYMVCGSARVYGGSSTAEGYLGLFKNGARIVSNGGLGFVQGSISFLVYFNGSTDYVQFYSNTSTAITNGAASTTTSFTMVYMTS